MQACDGARDGAGRLLAGRPRAAHRHAADAGADRRLGLHARQPAVHRPNLSANLAAHRRVPRGSPPRWGRARRRSRSPGCSPAARRSIPIPGTRSRRAPARARGRDGELRLAPEDICARSRGGALRAGWAHGDRYSPRAVGVAERASVRLSRPERAAQLRVELAACRCRAAQRKKAQRRGVMRPSGPRNERAAPGRRAPLGELEGGCASAEADRHQRGELPAAQRGAAGRIGRPVLDDTSLTCAASGAVSSFELAARLAGGGALTRPRRARDCRRAIRGSERQTDEPTIPTPRSGWRRPRRRTRSARPTRRSPRRAIPTSTPATPRPTARFKAAAAAHDLLKDPEKRAALRRRRDRRQRPGAAGAPVLPRVCRGAGGDLPHQPRLRGLRRLFGRLLRPLRRSGPAAGGGAGGEGVQMRGPDRHYTLDGGLPRGGAGRDPADHPAGRAGARREDPGGPGRRPDHPAARQGRRGHRRRRRRATRW